MSIAALIGAQGLIQLGISICDVAFIYEQARKIGNWIRVSENDEDLLELLGEDAENVFQRRGIIDPIATAARFPDVEFIYHEGKVSTKGKVFKSSRRQANKTPRKKGQLPMAEHTTSDSRTSEEFSQFTWFMVVLVTALDICLSNEGVLDVLVNVLIHVLGREDLEDAKSALQAGLHVNIASWRSVGQVRKVDSELRRAYQKTWKEKTGVLNSIAQLNVAEEIEARRFLQVLFKDDDNRFRCESASTLALACAIQRGGVSIQVSGTDREFESQLLVEYIDDDHPSRLHPPRQGLAQAGDRLQDRAEMISYPIGRPRDMVQAIRAGRETLNEMERYWNNGFNAGAEYCLVPEARYPYEKSTSEVDYKLDSKNGPNVAVRMRFEPLVSIMSNKSFPCRSQGVLEELEKLLQEAKLTDGGVEWLETHSGSDYLTRNEHGLSNKDKNMTKLWLKYQALVFGFYYGLLQSSVSLEYVNDEEAYFRGLWGNGSTTFLAMCTNFSQELQREGKVSRTHMLHMLATMYNGRPKLYNRHSSRLNLLGVFGKVTVVALPLIHTSDEPSELSKFAVLDLPIVHLVPESDGELYASPSWSIKSHRTGDVAQDVRVCKTTRKWSVHSSMAAAFPGSIPGVVMAARCEGRLVGWFTPVAADITFLSEAYQKVSGDEGDVSRDDRATVKGFQVLDEHWQGGSIPEPRVGDYDCNTFGVVQSSGCAALRYAAAGFYAGFCEEVVVSNGDIKAAFERIEAQERGIIIL